MSAAPFGSFLAITQMGSANISLRPDPQGMRERLSQVGFVPKSVALEVAAGSPDDPARRWLEAPQGAALIVRDVAPTSDLLAWDLGAGEIAVIAMAMVNPGYEMVLDDAAARRCAMVFGVPMRGTLSLVVLGKKWGLISACRPVFDRILAVGLYVSPALVEQVALAAGE